MLARKRARACSSVRSNQPATASSVAVAISVGPGASVSSGKPAVGFSRRRTGVASRSDTQSSSGVASPASRKYRSSNTAVEASGSIRVRMRWMAGHCLPLTNRSLPSTNAQRRSPASAPDGRTLTDSAATASNALMG